MALNIGVIGGAQYNTLSDVRNGILATIRAPARRGAIAAEYHWTGVGNTEIRDACLVYRAAVAASWAKLAAIGHPAGVAEPGNLAHYAAGVGAATADAGLRRRAIWFAGARAGASSAWRIADADLSNDEKTPATVFTVALAPAANVPAAIAGDIEAARVWQIANGAIALSTAHLDANADLTYLEALATSFAALSAAEEEECYAAFRLGSVAPVLNGLTLFMTNHHYLSSAQKAFLAVERQVIAADTVKASWDVDAPGLRDVVWHKACHPIRSAISMAFAAMDDIRDRMTALGIGSAGVRVPYVEDSVRAAQAYVALLGAVRPAVAGTNWTLGLPTLIAALHVLSAMGHAGAVPFGAPAGVVDRRTAIDLMLKPAMAVSEPAVAFLAGLYAGACEDADVNLRRDSIWNAKSVQRVVNSGVGAVANGRKMYNLVRRRDRALADSGHVPDVTLNP